MSAPDLAMLAAHFTEAFPVLDDAGRTIALNVYRRLAQGDPASAGDIAASSGLTQSDVTTHLDSWPGVYYDDQRRVIGFWGLAIKPMAHRLRVNGRTVYAWCAWDTLFLPELLQADVAVESGCRASGQAVRLTVTPARVERAEPAGMVVSFLLPDRAALNANVIASFCHYVHFFQSAQIAIPWLTEHPDAFVLSLADAHELGRRVNRARYAGFLGSTDDQPTSRSSPAR